VKPRATIQSVFSTDATTHLRTYVIAEIGINHEGNVDQCAEMIKAFARSGADAIKLQTVDADKAYSKNTDSHKVFSQSSLSQVETANMFNLARQLGIEPFTTSGDLGTLEWVDRLHPVAHKISSGLLSCLPVVEATCALKRPVIMSTGMSDHKTIFKATAIARESAVKAALMQCTSEYPCPIEKLELSAIRHIEKKYKLPTGFSDHSLGIDMAPLAVAAGARLIEKHVTFDKNRSGFDHFIALDQHEFAKMTEKIRAVEVALGGMTKRRNKRNFSQFERRLAAAKNLDAGHVLSISDFLFLRFPHEIDAIPAEDTKSVVGRTLKTGLATGEGISWHDLS
jgi:N,N'-diacetyllegionaminate synthase